MDLWLTVAEILVVVFPALLFTFTLVTALFAQFFQARLGAFTLITFMVLWLGALTAFGIVIFKGSVDFSLATLSFDSSLTPVFGFRADRLSLVIALLVITVSGIVHLYSLRAMQEEPHFRRYFLLLGLITLEVLLVVLANNLLMLGVCWILKGLTLTFLLAHYSERSTSWRAALKKLRIDLVGDAAFLVALVLTWQIFNTFDLEAINTRAAAAAQSLPVAQTTLLTALLLVAIMAKSAQFPLHGWLPGTVEAPTPVSALMHAGLINAGGFLFIRLSPLFAAAPLTMGLALLVGGFTTFYGTLVMLTRNDVKGKLVYSTMGQMGFMIVECALGAYALAVLHLVAHGLFKATLFLGSGSVIEQKVVKQHLSPVQYRLPAGLGTFRFFLASGLAALMFLTVPALVGWPVTTGTILLAFAWITIIFGLSEVRSLPLKVLLPATFGVVMLYLGFTHGLEVFFSGTLAASPVLSVSLIWSIGGGLALAGLVAALLKTWGWGAPDWLRSLLTRLYVRVLFAG